MEQMTKARAVKIGAIALKALKKAFEDEGIDVSRGNGSFDPDAGTLGVKFTFTIDGGMGKDAAAFQRYQSFRFPNWNLGDKLNLSGADWEVVGYRPRASKYPFVLKKCAGGEIRLHPWDTLEAKLGERAVPNILRGKKQAS